MRRDGRKQWGTEGKTATALIGVLLLFLGGSRTVQPAESPAPVVIASAPAENKECIAEQNQCRYEDEEVCRYYAIIQMAAQRHAVETSLLMAIVQAESQYNPRAVSHQGAKGMMQLMPRTAESLGVVDCFDPVQNVNAGARYFKRMLELFKGDRKQALAAYLVGPQSVMQHGGIPPVPSMHAYVHKILAWYEHYKNAQHLFPAQTLAAAERTADTRLAHAGNRPPADRPSSPVLPTVGMPN